MNWKEYVGGRLPRVWLQNALSNRRLASTFLLVGSPNIGKRTFAELVAKSLLCRNTATDRLDFCGVCESCIQVAAGTHPDLIRVEKPADKSEMPLEILVGPRENRMREGLLYEIGLKSFYGGRRIAIIDDADSLNEEGANALLKTLEEPPDNVHIFLISESLPLQLPTIRSRCQIISFVDPTPQERSELMLRNYGSDRQSIVEEESRIPYQAASIEEFVEHADLREFRSDVVSALGEFPIPVMALSKAITSHVDSVAKESAIRRQRLRLVFSTLIDLLRYCIVAGSAGTTSIASPVPKSFAAFATTISDRLGNQMVPLLAKAIERCLDSQEQIDRNIAPAAIVESWATDMAAILKA